MIQPSSGSFLNTVRLDDFPAVGGAGHVDLLKVDVEGGELDVLFSAESLIRQRRVANVVVEMGREGNWLHARRSRASALQLLHLFHDSGYECRALRMMSQPSTNFVLPCAEQTRLRLEGECQFDATFASWPTSRTGRVEYTTVGKDNFDAFMTLLVKVDFNVWFRAL